MSEAQRSAVLLKASRLEQMRAPLADDAGTPAADLAALIDFSGLGACLILELPRRPASHNPPPELETSRLRDSG